MAELIIGFIGYRSEESTLPIEKQSSFVLSYNIKMEKSGSIDIRLKVSGQGTLIIDTIQIIPLS
jgi:hypothetical protein